MFTESTNPEIIGNIIAETVGVQEYTVLNPRITSLRSLTSPFSRCQQMQSPDQTKPSLSPPFLPLTAMTNFKKSLQWKLNVAATLATPSHIGGQASTPLASSEEGPTTSQKPKTPADRLEPFKSIQVPSNQNQSSPNNRESQSLDTLALQGISMRSRETSTRSSPVVSSSPHDLALAWHPVS